MKLKTILTASLALSGVAFAQTKQFNEEGEIPQFLKRYDVDNNNIIDEEERQMMEAMRNSSLKDRQSIYDTDNDGVISEAELEAARAAYRGAITERRIQEFNEVAGEDGVLSVLEYKTLQNQIIYWNPLDLNGALDRHDRLDYDVSGDLSLEEFLDWLTLEKAPDYGSVDLNNDGEISADERAALKEQVLKNERARFDKYVRGNETISQHEWRVYLNNIAPTEASFFRNFDKNGDGRVTKAGDDVRDFFLDRYDTNGDDELEYNEFVDAAGERQYLADASFEAYDLDSDGEVSFAEWNKDIESIVTNIAEGALARLRGDPVPRLPWHFSIVPPQ